MVKRLLVIVMLAGALASVSPAQNTNTSTQQTRQRTTTKTTTTKAAPAIKDEQSGEPQTGATTTKQTSTRRTSQTAQGASSASSANGANDPTSKGVLAAFNNLLDGIRHSDVEAVTGAYWNSPQLVLFNNNGTVTRGWEQLHQNRASSYPNMKDVKLDVRDLRVQMLGREGALITCLWTQSQTFKGAPETASGRMTIVFRRTNGTWKAVHLHTSPDAPEPSRLAPSEQTATPKKP